jgi:hypothetical protein
MQAIGAREHSKWNYSLSSLFVLSFFLFCFSPLFLSPRSKQKTSPCITGCPSSFDEFCSQRHVEYETPVDVRLCDCVGCKIVVKG